jgi:hypothetical protein
MSKKITTVVDAEQTLKQLEDRRRALIERGQEIAETRKRISFAALADGDQKAKRALDDLNAEAVAHGATLESVLAAIAEAEQRVAVARRAEAAEAERANANAIKQVVAELVEHAGVADDALHDLILAASNLRDCLNKLHALGSDYPSHALADVNFTLALKTALMQLPNTWKRDFVEHLAPGHRRQSFAALCQEYARRIEANVVPHLGEAEQTKEVA